tara:strand:+ start:115 stop:681 length:567 start_codon:yes stop_codon:yes gene_type:complete
MKKLLLLIFTFSLVACSSGDDDNNNSSNNSSQSNVLSVGGTDYQIEDGALVDFGLWGASDAVNIDLSLISFEYDIDCFNEEDESSIPDDGQTIYFEMWTSQQGYLDSGTYEIVGLNDDDYYSPFHISVSEYSLDHNNETSYDDILSGTVNVERSGNSYTISWDTIDENGNVVAGSFIGTLQYCDVSND